MFRLKTSDPDGEDGTVIGGGEFETFLQDQTNTESCLNKGTASAFERKNGTRKKQKRNSC